jgi:hypothetical protein
MIFGAPWCGCSSVESPTVTGKASPRSSGIKIAGQATMNVSIKPQRVILKPLRVRTRASSYSYSENYQWIHS